MKNVLKELKENSRDVWTMHIACSLLKNKQESFDVLIQHSPIQDPSLFILYSHLKKNYKTLFIDSELD